MKENRFQLQKPKPPAREIETRKLTKEEFTKKFLADKKAKNNAPTA